MPPVEFVLPNEPSIMVFIGKQRSGKSYAIRSLMRDFQEHQPFSFGITYCKTKFNHGYDYMPPESVKDKFSIEALMSWVNKLREGAEKYAAQGKKFPRNYIILDDLVGAIKWYDGNMDNWVSTFRHTNKWVFITAQYLARGSSTTLRECTDYAFIFNTSNEESMKVCSTYYGQRMPGNDTSQRLECFMKTLNDVTEAQDHHCLLFMSRPDRKLAPGERFLSRDYYVSWKASPVDDDFKVVFRK